MFPIEEPEPAGLLSSIKLRPYQRQSLAFMLQLERDTGVLARRQKLIGLKGGHHQRSDAARARAWTPRTCSSPWVRSARASSRAPAAPVRGLSAEECLREIPLTPFSATENHGESSDTVLHHKESWGIV